jgi:hypothetical protein
MTSTSVVNDRSHQMRELAPGSAGLHLGAGVPLRPAEQTFEAMLDGWRNQQLARRLAFPWEWTPTLVDEWMTGLRAVRRLRRSTLWGHQIAVRLFCGYITDPVYGWSAECEKWFDHHPIIAACDNTGEPLAWMLRPGSAGSSTAADHLLLLGDTITALPPALRRKLMITCDGAGASHALVKELDRLASRHGYQVTWPVGWELGARERAAIGKVPEPAWEVAIDGKGEVRERRSDDACGNPRCAHRKCWIEEAHVAQLTGLLREGPDGDQLKGWPKAMRVFARRERPHPGA